MNLKSNAKSSSPQAIAKQTDTVKNQAAQGILLTELVGNNNFHIVPIRKGGVHETKIVCYSEEHYRKIAKYLTEKNKNFYTYQLKSSKGLQDVIKGIDDSV